MDSRLTKHKALPKPLFLKDYLLEDMSSCSSNGFKSFPRRQCFTTTVRLLIDIDLKNIKQQKKYLIFKKTPPDLRRNPSKPALSVFQRVIAAVKRLPFAAASSPEKKNIKISILPRNLSKKIVTKSSFWKRKTNYKDIERWKYLDQLQRENSEQLHTRYIKSKSWSGSDFTASEASLSGSSPSEVHLNSTQEKNAAVKILKSGDVSTDSITSSDSITTNSSTKKKPSANEEKEQFSPVSVLDCPFHDDGDEEVSSPLHMFQLMQGTKENPRFCCLAQLEPVNLAKRFGLLPDSYSSIAILNTKEEKDDDNGENHAERKALDLLQQFKDALASHKLKADKLLLDFFREKIINHDLHSQRQRGEFSFDEELLEEAEGWINGRNPDEMFLGCEAPRKRQAYIEDIERSEEWKALDQEIEGVASELETDVFAALLNELLLDISSKTNLNEIQVRLEIIMC